MSSEMTLAKVTVSSVTYPVTAQVIAGVTIAGFSMQNMNYSNAVYFSFDGTNDAGYLLPVSILEGVALPSPTVSYTTTKTSIWLRLETAGTAAVRVMGAG